jgi:AmiR/NasT family two-component response regulator
MRSELFRRESIIAGIWEGRQLDAHECARLKQFCGELAARNAPVVAVLDFPRLDRCAQAYELGAAAVVGKPWDNASLLETLRRAVQQGLDVEPQSRAA